MISRKSLNETIGQTSLRDRASSFSSSMERNVCSLKSSVWSLSFILHYRLDPRRNGFKVLLRSQMHPHVCLHSSTTKFRLLTRRKLLRRKFTPLIWCYRRVFYTSLAFCHRSGTLRLRRIGIVRHLHS